MSVFQPVEKTADSFSESEITVRLTPSRPLHLACDPGATRFSMANVRIEPVTQEGKHGVICAATNGRILVVAKEEGVAKQCDLAPAACFSCKKTDDIEVEKNGHWIKRTSPKKRRYGGQAVTEVSIPAPEGRFPKYRDILPTFSSGDHLVVSLDPEFLMTLATAMGRDEERKAITLFIPIEKQTVPAPKEPTATSETNEATETSPEPAEEHLFCNGPIAALLYHPDKGTAIGVLMPCESSPKNDREVFSKFVESLGPEPIEPPKAPAAAAEETIESEEVAND